MLNDRQRLLAQAKAKGLTDLDACREAGYKAKTHEAASNQVARMMRKDEFCTYLEALREESRSSNVATAEEIKEAATRMLSLAEANEDFTGFSQLSNLLCKMEGHYSAEKHEHEVTGKALADMLKEAQE